MKAMLLAAGQGTRLRPLTQNTAKPSLPFLGLPLAFYMLYYLEQLVLDTLVVNTHYKPESVKNIFGSVRRYQLIFSHERDKILGSSGGVYKARHDLFPPVQHSTTQHAPSQHSRTGGQPVLNRLSASGASPAAQAWQKPVVICNADSVILFAHNRGFEPLLEAHQKTGAWLTFLTTTAQQAQGHTVTTEGGKKNAPTSKPSQITTQQAALKEGAGGSGPSLLWTQGTQLKKVGRQFQPNLKPEHFTGVYIMSPQVRPFLQPESELFLDLVGPALQLQNTVPPYAIGGSATGGSATGGSAAGGHASRGCASGLRWPEGAVQTYYDPHLKWFNTNTVEDFQASQKSCLQLPRPYKTQLAQIQLAQT